MKKIEQLNAIIGRIGVLMRHLERQERGPQQIEADLLLQELRTAYALALTLEVAEIDDESADATDFPSNPSDQLDAEKQDDVVTSVSQEAMADTAPSEPAHEVPVDGNGGITATIPAIDDDEEVPALSLMQDVEPSDNSLFDDSQDAAGWHDEPVSQEVSEQAADSRTEATDTPTDISQEPQNTVLEASVSEPVTPKEEQDVASAQRYIDKEKPASLFDYLHAAAPAQEPAVAETLGDKLGRSGGEMRGTTAQYKKIADLRTVININDKFSFMKDLFQNNMKAYNDFIIELNGITERSEAERRVNEVAALYHWDSNSLTAKKFFSIFDRRF